VSLSLENKIILVTGAASGIGAATVGLIRARGGVAIGTDLHGADIDHDVTDPAAWDRAIAHAVQQHGRLDGLVSNAGRASWGAVADQDLEDFRASYRVNVEAAFIGIQKAVAQFRAQGSLAQGSIVVTSSVMATQAAPGTASYAVTKAALQNMARAIGVELGRKGDFIRVNAVAPGPVRTPMLAGAMPEGAMDDPATWADVPLKEPCEPEDVAEAIAFLLSDESSFMTAAVQTLDGGWSLT
jgi:NAD(P)-dependent dehydrogenase (short-subunit alcohol dehydrogenase family)